MWKEQKIDPLLIVHYWTETEIMKFDTNLQ
jgi:hypothetical protein